MDGDAAARAGVWREHYAPLISDIAFLIEAALGPHDHQGKDGLAALAAQATAMEQELCSYLQANAMPATLQLMRQAVAAITAAAAVASAASQQHPALDLLESSATQHQQLQQPLTVTGGGMVNIPGAAHALAPAGMAGGSMGPADHVSSSGKGNGGMEDMDLADQVAAMSLGDGLGSGPTGPVKHGAMHASMMPSPHALAPHSCMVPAESPGGPGCSPSSNVSSFLWAGGNSPPGVPFPHGTHDSLSAPDLPCLPPAGWGSTPDSVTAGLMGTGGMGGGRWVTGGSSAPQQSMRPGSDGAMNVGLGMGPMVAGGYMVPAASEPRSRSDPQMLQPYQPFPASCGIQVAPMSDPSSAASLPCTTYGSVHQADGQAVGASTWHAATSSDPGVACPQSPSMLQNHQPQGLQGLVQSSVQPAGQQLLASGMSLGGDGGHTESHFGHVMGGGSPAAQQMGSSAQRLRSFLEARASMDLADRFGGHRQALLFLGVTGGSWEEQALPIRWTGR